MMFLPIIYILKSGKLETSYTEEVFTCSFIPNCKQLVPKETFNAQRFPKLNNLFSSERKFYNSSIVILQQYYRQTF